MPGDDMPGLATLSHALHKSAARPPADLVPRRREAGGVAASTSVCEPMQTSPYQRPTRSAPRSATAPAARTPTATRSCCSTPLLQVGSRCPCSAGSCSFGYWLLAPALGPR